MENQKIELNWVKSRFFSSPLCYFILYVRSHLNILSTLFSTRENTHIHAIQISIDCVCTFENRAKWYSHWNCSRGMSVCVCVFFSSSLYLCKPLEMKREKVAAAKSRHTFGLWNVMIDCCRANISFIEQFTFYWCFVKYFPQYSCRKAQSTLSRLHNYIEAFTSFFLPSHQKTEAW